MQDAKIHLLLDDAAFARLCAEQIAPSLQECQAQERAAVSAYYQRHGWALLGAAIIGVVAGLSTQFIVGLAAGVAAYTLLGRSAAAPMNSSAERTRARTLGALAEAVDCAYHHESETPSLYQRLLKLWLLPQSDEAVFNDRFSGRCNGQDFEFCAARLETLDNRQRSVRFDGFLVRIAFPKDFFGTTIIRRDAGSVGNWFEEGRVREKFRRAYLGSPEIDKTFEVYTTDQTEARYLADFAFLTRLAELEHEFDGRDLRFAFAGGDLLIAVERSSPRREPEVEPTDPTRMFKRVLVYESYYQAGQSVDAKTAEEIEQALDKDNPPPAAKPVTEPDSLEPIRAATADARQILRLVAKVLESGSLENVSQR